MKNKKKIKVGFFTKALGTSIVHINNVIKMLDDEQSICIDSYVVFFYSPLFKVQHFNDFSNLNNNIEFVHLKNIKQIIKHSINFMVIINSNHFVEMMIIQYCREVGIKSILFQHGMKIDWEKNKEVLRKGSNKSKWIRGSFKYLQYSKFILANIIYLKEPSKLVIAYRNKIKIIAQKGLIGFSQQYGIPSHRCDSVLAYSQIDADNYCINYGHLKHEIHIMGYPLGSPGQSQVEWENYVLFLSGALRKGGVISCSISEEIEYYQSMIDEIQKTDKKLIIKLHPQEDPNNFSALKFDENRVKIVKNINLVDVVSKSSIVISDYSTALYNAVLFKKRIIILRNQLLDPYPFDYTVYGIGVKVWMKDLAKTINGFQSLNLSKSDNQNYDNFIKKFIAPATDFSLLKVFDI